MPFHPSTRSTGRLLAALLAAMAVTAPAAAAKPSTGGVPGGEPPQVVSIDPGFDVESAVVGAGAGACLASLVALGFGALHGRRRVGTVR
jgi:hypothetical protein